MILTEQQKILIMTIPETDYGRALFAWISQEVEALEKADEHGGKICDAPLIEDFRTQKGIMIGLKRVLRKPQELKDENLKQQGARQ